MGRSLYRADSYCASSVNFIPLPITGAYLLEISPQADERGFFARTVCREECARYGVNADFVQQSVSFNHRRGILRGLHYQMEPNAEEKLVRVTMGALFDVIIDLRLDSASYRSWYGVELSAENHVALYIPKGVAHGFQTISDNTEVFYQMSEFFAADCARGLRWNDPAFGITWPPGERIINERDSNYPDFKGP